MQRIVAHCGQAFEGRLAANEPADPNDPFVGQRLVMHVRQCSDDELMIPFHVGEDRSRTWIITRTDTGAVGALRAVRPAQGAVQCAPGSSSVKAC